MSIQTATPLDPARTASRNPGALALIVAIAATCLLVALVYWPGLHGGFVFDDFQNIVDNPAFASRFDHWQDWFAVALSSPASTLQRPLAMLSFAANVHFAGLDPVSMKATNVAIHLLNVLLVFLLVRAIVRGAATAGRNAIGTDWIALFVAACWGLHPINLTAVLYVVQRMESLCHVFVFAGLWSYVAGRQRQIAGKRGAALVWGGLLFGTMLGTLSKESAVLLPVYAFAVEVFLFKFRGADQQRSKSIVAMYVLVLVIPALFALAWQLPIVLRPGAYSWREFTLPERLLTESRVVMTYLRWTLFPSLRAMGLYHDDFALSRSLLDPPTTLAALLAIPAICGLAWWQRRRLPLTALGVAWFFSAQLLTATVIPLELVYEHRNYFASLGICLALAELLLLAMQDEGRRIGLLLAGCFLLICAGTTALRAQEWSSPIRFASSEAARHSASPRATYEYVRAMIIAGNYDPHSPLNPKIMEALAKAEHVPDSSTLPEQAALMFSAHTGLPLVPGTWENLRDKLRHNRFSAEEQISLISVNDCVISGACRFSREQMLATFAAALENAPDDPRLLSIYGKYAIYALGDLPLGLRLWREAALRAPANATFQVNLIALLIDLGHIGEARAHIATLRGLGRLEQYAPVADRFSERIRQNAPAHQSSLAPDAP